MLPPALLGDKSPRATALADKGQPAGFVARLDSSGKWLWAVSAELESIEAVAADNAGNSYITGSKDNDVVVAKVDAEGYLSWIITGGGLEEDAVSGLAVDSEGNVYVAGTFRQTADFGMWTLVSKGETDVFVWKIRSGQSP